MQVQRPAVSKTEFAPEYGRAVRVREFNRPMMSDDVETAQTIAYMEELACFDAGERSVIEAANEALSDAGIDLNADAFHKACAIFWWLKRHIHYEPTPATSALVDQTLIAPSAFLQMRGATGKPHGDCPQFSMLAAAMCRICCVPCAFKTIAADPAYPNIFSHVYNVVDIGQAKPMPFDSSNGPSPGAEYAIALKSKVWPRTIPENCKPKGNPMLRSRAYRSTRNAGLHGTMGSDDGTDIGIAPTIPGGYGNIDAAGGQLDIGMIDSSIAQATPIFAPPTPGTSFPTVPQQSFGTTIANDLTSLLSPLTRAFAASTAKPYYVTNAQGQQVLYNPATGQVVGSSSLSNISGRTWAVIAVVAVVLISSRNK